MKVKKYVVEVAKGEWGVHTDWIETEFNDIETAKTFVNNACLAGNAVRMYVKDVFEEETE
jgi:hypothetical protein